MGSPFHRRTVLALALFSAISSIAGGVEMLLFPRGNAYVPLTLLDGSPFATFVVPGLLLALVIGGSSTAAAVLVWRRASLAIDATILAGGALLVWIVAEMAMLREFHWLHALYGGLGLSILALGLDAALRSGTARLRWVVAVTLAETVGFAVPGIAGIVGQQVGLDGVASGATLVAAGFVEGLVCGGGQAWALPLPIRRRRFALLTALGSAAVWAMVLAAMAGFRDGAAGPRFIVATLGLAAVGLPALGFTQWLELRRVAVGAHRWIAWTALASALALPTSLLPEAAIDASTPATIHLVLWTCAGALMAYTMALVTWQGAKRLRARDPRCARIP